MGGKSSKQTTENKPPAWATPLFAQSAGEAQKLYNSGSGGNVYQGQTVAGLGNTTQAGIAGVSNAANGLSAAANNWNMPNYQNMLSGTNSIRSNANDQFLASTKPTSAESNLRDMASGTYLKSGNPFFEDALRGQLDKTAAQTQSQFSGSGRYGSGANTDVLTNQLGNIRSNALSNQFNQDTQNMLSANNMIDSSRIAARSSGTNALGMQNNALQTGAAIGNQAFQNQLAGANAALSGAGAQIEAGQLQDDNLQKQLIADFTKWQSNDMKDWNRLGLLQAAAAGSAGNYGTNTQTQTQPFNALGAIGSLGGLFKSDKRLKEAVFLTGYHRGLPVYDFAYTGSRTRWTGVMAQDVIELAPEAVVLEDDGFYAVDYGMIGFAMERAA